MCVSVCLCVSVCGLSIRAAEPCRAQSKQISHPLNKDSMIIHEVGDVLILKTSCNEKDRY